MAHQEEHAQLDSLQLYDETAANVPQLNPAKSIARRQVLELSPAELKKQFWKTETPVIITGVLLILSNFNSRLLHAAAELPCCLSSYGVLLLVVTRKDVPK